MKNIFLFSTFLFLGFLLKAQEQPNLVKINVLPLVAGNLSLEYERPIAPKITVNGTLSWRPKTGLPFKSLIKKMVGEETAMFDGAKLGAFSLTPEIRFYMKDKGNFKGFYIAPYIKYSSYSLSLDLPIEELNDQVTGVIPASGHLNAFTFGFAIGSQWKLSDAVYLDWRILGPGYGFSNGKIIGRKDLSPNEQAVLRDEISGIEDVPVMKLTYDVDENGVTINSKGPFAGIRTALSIGYRF